jgi:hypothetical protein
MVYSSIGVWFAMVAAVLASAAFAGVPVTLATTAVAIVVGLIPPVMMLRLCVNPERARVVVDAK